MGAARRVRRRAAALSALSALMAATVIAVGPVGADPNAGTSDRSVAVKTSSWFYTGVDAATIQSDLGVHKARLTHIEIDPGAAPETFTVTMVANSGAYAVAQWWWYVDRTRAQIDTDLAANDGRLIDLTAYQTPAGEEYAYIMVANTGADARSWSYDVDTDPTTIQNDLNARNSRLEEVRGYMVGSTEEYAAIMVAQTGIDAKNWYWALGWSAAQIQNVIDAWQYRLISLEPDPSGGYDAVLVASEGEWWWWYTATTAAKIQALAKTQHARVVTISPDATGYSAVMLDNTDATSKPINAESVRVNKLMAKDLDPALFGVYLKQVGGPVELAANAGYRYEPASAIKVLYLLYAMHEVQSGADSLSSDFVYYPDPSDPSNPGVCPDPSWETSGNAQHTTLQQALTAMMDVSDNRMTRGMVLRYGIANVEAYARSIGLNDTYLVQDRIGCLFVNGVRNQLTLSDIASLYEQVDNGSLLNSTNQSTFNSIMLGGAVPSTSALGNIVRQEAKKAGKGQDAAAFIAAMDYREKAGNEFECVSSNCSSNPMYLDFTSVAGRMTIPFKQAGHIVPVDYVYGRFANDFVLNCLPGSGSCTGDSNTTAAISTLGTVGAETFRQQIADALATW